MIYKQMALHKGLSMMTYIVVSILQEAFSVRGGDLQFTNTLIWFMNDLIEVEGTEITRGCLLMTIHDWDGDYTSFW